MKIVEIMATWLSILFMLEELMMSVLLRFGRYYNIITYVGLIYSKIKYILAYMWPKSNQKIFKITLLTSVLNQNIQQKVYKFQMTISYKEEKWTTKNFPSKQEAF
jgi:hypothetical protein